MSLRPNRFSQAVSTAIEKPTGSASLRSVKMSTYVASALVRYAGAMYEEIDDAEAASIAHSTELINEANTLVDNCYHEPHVFADQQAATKQASSTLYRTAGGAKKATVGTSTTEESKNLVAHTSAQSSQLEGDTPPIEDCGGELTTALTGASDGGETLSSASHPQHPKKVRPPQSYLECVASIRPPSSDHETPKIVVGHSIVKTIKAVIHEECGPKSLRPLPLDHLLEAIYLSLTEEDAQRKGFIGLQTNGPAPVDLPQGLLRSTSPDALNGAIKQLGAKGDLAETTTATMAMAAQKDSTLSITDSDEQRVAEAALVAAVTNPNETSTKEVLASQMRANTAIAAEVFLEWDRRSLALEEAMSKKRATPQIREVQASRDSPVHGGPSIATDIVGGAIAAAHSDLIETIKLQQAEKLRHLQLHTKFASLQKSARSSYSPLLVRFFGELGCERMFANSVADLPQTERERLLVQAVARRSAEVESRKRFVDLQASIAVADAALASTTSSGVLSVAKSHQQLSYARRKLSGQGINVPVGFTSDVAGVEDDADRVQNAPLEELLLRRTTHPMLEMAVNQAAVRVLDFSGGYVGSNATAAIAIALLVSQCPNVHTLNLSGLHLHQVGFELLCGSAPSSTVSALHPSLKGKGIHTMTTHPSLVQVNLRGNFIEERHIRSLCAALLQFDAAEVVGSGAHGTTSFGGTHAAGSLIGGADPLAYINGPAHSKSSATSPTSKTAFLSHRRLAYIAVDPTDEDIKNGLYEGEGAALLPEDMSYLPNSIRIQPYPPFTTYFASGKISSTVTEVRIGAMTSAGGTARPNSAATAATAYSVKTNTSLGALSAAKGGSAFSNPTNQMNGYYSKSAPKASGYTVNQQHAIANPRLYNRNRLPHSLVQRLRSVLRRNLVLSVIHTVPMAMIRDRWPHELSVMLMPLLIREGSEEAAKEEAKMRDIIANKGHCSHPSGAPASPYDNPSYFLAKQLAEFLANDRTTYAELIDRAVQSLEGRPELDDMLRDAYFHYYFVVRGVSRKYVSLPHDSAEWEPHASYGGGRRAGGVPRSVLQHTLVGSLDPTVDE